VPPAPPPPRLRSMSLLVMRGWMREGRWGARGRRRKEGGKKRAVMGKGGMMGRRGIVSWGRAWQRSSSGR